MSLAGMTLIGERNLIEIIQLAQASLNNTGMILNGERNLFVIKERVQVSLINTEMSPAGMTLIRERNLFEIIHVQANLNSIGMPLAVMTLIRELS